MTDSNKINGNFHRLQIELYSQFPVKKITQKKLTKQVETARNDVEIARDTVDLSKEVLEMINKNSITYDFRDFS